MSFSVIYYVCVCCPTAQRTMEMVDRYVARGAKAFQIDMPSKDPFSETDFVKEMMKRSLDANTGYDGYMETIRKIWNKHPDVALHLVVYNDVVDSIGVEKLLEFGKEIGARSFMIPGATEENFKRIEDGGFKVFRRITHHMEPQDIQFAIDGGKDAYISLRNRKPDEHDIPGFETWPQKYAYIRQQGVQGRVYSVFGIRDPQTLRQIRDTGAQGAIIGNVLMRLWDDEEKLWELFDAFQAYSDEGAE